MDGDGITGDGDLGQLQVQAGRRRDLNVTVCSVPGPASMV
jgi:hypothetical protein